MTVRKVRIGDVLQLQRRKVEVVGESVYREIGLRSFGKGVFHKEEISGFDLGSKKVFEIHPGDLLVSNVFAWEGAVAVAGPTESGFVGSHRFMTWTPKIDDIDVKYLACYFTSDAGIQQLQRASPGSAGRNKTLGIAAFEDIQIPLPRIHEQRRIAARLASLRTAIDCIDRPDDAGIAAMDRMEAELISSLLSDAVPMRDLAVINPSPERVPPETDVVFAPMATLNVEDGSLHGAEVRKRSEIGAGYKQFSRGDIVFARITPSMQNGKSAVFDDTEVRIGYGTTEFHVLRAESSALVPALHALVRSTWFKSLAKQSFTGTAGQQRVPASFLANVLVPDIRKASVRRAIERLKDLEDDRWRIRALVARRRELTTALPKAVRNVIFSKLV